MLVLCMTTLSYIVYTDYSVHMYGGDIALTPEQQATLEATTTQNSPFSIQHAVVSSEQYLWKGGIIYYIFDESLGEKDLTCTHNNAFSFSLQHYTDDNASSQTMHTCVCMHTIILCHTMHIYIIIIHTHMYTTLYAVTCVCLKASYLLCASVHR